MNLKIAVITTSGTQLGGGATFERSMWDQISAYPWKNANFDLWSLKDSSLSPHAKYQYSFGFGHKVFVALRSSLPIWNLLRYTPIRLSKLENRLIESGVDLVWFASPNPVALGFLRVPFISTVWDLAHREMPGYPEFAQDMKYEERETFYRAVLPRSMFITIESLILADKCGQYYGIDEDRFIDVGVLPSKPIGLDSGGVCAEDLQVPENARIVWYPAQFWSHKRHKYAIDIFETFVNKYSKDGDSSFLILTGSDQGNRQEIENYIRERGLQSKVLLPGFVQPEAIAWLFRNSAAMLFPSLLGNQNLPPIEAALAGLPVVQAAHRQYREDLPSDLDFRPISDEIDAWAEALDRAMNSEVRAPMPWSSSWELPCAALDQRFAQVASVLREFR